MIQWRVGLRAIQPRIAPASQKPWRLHFPHADSKMVRLATAVFSVPIQCLRRLLTVQIVCAGCPGLCVQPLASALDVR